MSVIIMCFNASDGIPIFTRKKGNFENIPYSVMGSMNGIHVFGKSHQIRLNNILTKEMIIYFKEFYNSITLICIAKQSTTILIEQLLLLVFNIMVTVVGLNQLRCIKSADKLKQDLKIAYPIIDKILMSFINQDSTVYKDNLGILSTTEVIVCSESNSLQISLDSYCECINTKFGCILLSGRIVIATESWWQLHADERNILALFAINDQHLLSKEYYLFLPHKKSNVIFRYVFCTLMNGIQLCVLCGPKPKLNEFEQSIRQYFKTNSDTLRILLKYYPFNLPISIHINFEIQSLLLINRKIGKFILSKNPFYSNAKRFLPVTKNRTEILLNFYNRTVQRFLIENNKSFDKGKKQITDSEEKTNAISKLKLNTEDICHDLKEIYAFFDEFKCYAVLQNDNHLLCVLVSNYVPTYVLRTLTLNTLKTLLSDKLFF